MFHLHKKVFKGFVWLNHGLEFNDGFNGIEMHSGDKSRKFRSPIGELEFYFRKIPLHQQKFLVVSVLSNSPWLPKNLKNGPK